MTAQNLASALAEDIAEAGLATLIDSTSLESLDCRTLIELEQDGDTIEVYENGDAIAEFSTSDEDFNDKFMATLATSLNF